MKIIALLLSIYLTALSVVPCTDSMTSCTSHSGIELSMDEHDHDHSDHQDGCTPFCVCACCGSLVILPTVQKMEILKLRFLQISYLITHSHIRLNIAKASGTHPYIVKPFSRDNYVLSDHSFGLTFSRRNNV